MNLCLSFKKIFIVSTLALSSMSFAQVYTDSDEFVSALAEAKKNSGLQIGIVIDSHMPSENIHYEIITLAQDSASAYDAVEKASIQKSYYPGYDAPNVMIIGLNGVSAQKINGKKRRDWAFLFLNPSFNWVSASTGVGGYSLTDGEILGFSLTAWVEKSGLYTPELLPKAIKKP